MSYFKNYTGNETLEKDGFQVFESDIVRNHLGINFTTGIILPGEYSEIVPDFFGGT